MNEPTSLAHHRFLSPASIRRIFAWIGGGWVLAAALRLWLGRGSLGLVQLGLGVSALAMAWLTPRFERALGGRVLPHLLAAFVLGMVGLNAVAAGGFEAPVLWGLMFLPVIMTVWFGRGAGVGWGLGVLGLNVGLWAAARVLGSRVTTSPEELLLLRAIVLVVIVLCAYALRVPTEQYIAVMQAKDRELQAQAAELARARDEALEAARSKTRLLATMSHELRTPLNAVLGMADLLRRTPLDEEQHEMTSTIQHGSEVLLGLIGDILDYAKLEAGKLDPEQVSFSLLECVEGALEMVAPQAQGKGLELLLEMRPEVPCTIVSDPVRLRQIVVNLLSNATKFTAQGEVRLLVERGEGSDELRFLVEDTGEGIPKDRQEQLFRPFVQVDASTTRKFGGTGLGLAISKALAGLLGGRMWLESEPGRGSRFWFTIRAPMVGPVEPLPARKRWGRVVVVEANASARRIACERLARLAREVVAVGGAAEGREALRAAATEVLVIDPREEGSEELALVADALDGKLGVPVPAAVPVVAMVPVASQRRAALEQVLGKMERRAGARLLYKPIKPLQLEAAIEGVIEGRPSAVFQRPTSRSKDATALRVLVAEDNPVNQKVARKMLERLGHQVTLADDGQQALLAMERERFDVVLLDVQMPVLDGLQTAERVVERWPREQRPRLIGLTANALPGDRERCLAVGMDDYMSKPIQLDVLERVLRRGSPPMEEPLSTLAGVLGVTSPGEMGPEVGERMRLFEREGPAKVEQIEQALARGDLERLKAEAAELEALSSGLGAVRLFALTASILADAEAGNLPKMRLRIERLRRELQSVLSALTRRAERGGR